MKVNPVAIQAYQQLNRQERTAPQENRAAADREASKLTLEPQKPEGSSTLAVRASSENYSKFLSNEERQAVELLFNRFRDSGRFGSSYGADALDAANQPVLGQLFDVKV